MIIDNPIVTGSINVQNAVTASNISIASTASAVYFTGSFIGDGTQLTGVTSYTDTDTENYINSLGVLSGSAQIASDISGSFTSLSSSLEQRITSQESFSSSLDTTFATDSELSSVSESLAASIAGISTDFTDITNKPALISSSAQFTDLTAPFTGSFTGSFFGDGSNLSGVTSYTDTDTLDFINSISVLSGSIAELTAVTASFSNTGSVTIPHSFNSKNVSVAVYDDSDILIIPQEIALISNNAVRITFGGSTSGFAVVAKGGHIVSGSVPVPQLSTVTDSFTSATTHTVTHNFNTKEVIVSVYEGDTFIIPDSITTDDVNNVTVTFPEAVTGRVVVVKAGHIVSGSIPFDNLLSSPFEQGTLAVTSSKHIVPLQDQTYDLGSSTLRFRDLYLSSASIFLGNTVISEDNVVTTASLASVLPDNVVSSSAQIGSDISGSFTSVSASLASDISLNAGSINSLNSASSSYLLNTTDTLDGNLTVSGSLSITGNISTTGTLTASGYNSSNWDTAYGWGNHATAGYDKAYIISVISGNTTGVKDVAYVLTANLTLTLPASPSVGDKIKISNQSGTVTPVVARNGQRIQGLLENLVLDVDGFGIELIYSGATKGWVLI